MKGDRHRGPTRRIRRIGVDVRLPRALANLMRAIVVLFAVQFSGVAHYAADLFVHGDCAADCPHERSSDDDHHDCPPGCPACHACSHHLAACPPVTVPLLPVLMGGEVSPLPYDTSGLATGERASVERPPRA